MWALIPPWQEYWILASLHPLEGRSLDPYSAFVGMCGGGATVFLGFTVCGKKITQGAHHLVVPQIMSYACLSPHFRVLCLFCNVQRFPLYLVRGIGNVCLHFSVHHRLHKL